MQTQLEPEPLDVSCWPVMEAASGLFAAQLQGNGAQQPWGGMGNCLAPLVCSFCPHALHAAGW